MISIDSKIEIYLYGGSTDMRKGMHGLAMLIEENIEKKYGKEGLFVFRSKRGDRIRDCRNQMQKDKKNVIIMG